MAVKSFVFPMIGQTYEIDVHEGQSFIAMEYLEGQTLKYRTARKPPKTETLLIWLRRLPIRSTRHASVYVVMRETFDVAVGEGLAPPVHQAT